MTQNVVDTDDNEAQSDANHRPADGAAEWKGQRLLIDPLRAPLRTQIVGAERPSCPLADLYEGAYEGIPRGSSDGTIRVTRLEREQEALI